MTVATMVTNIDDVLSRRQRAKHEIDRLKTIIASCDVEIMSALDAEEDEFTRWVLEVRGEIQDYEKRKIKWTDSKGDNYVVYKRKGSEPRKTISPEKLLQQGVPPSTIQAATTYGQPGKPGISVRKVTGAIDDSDED